METKFTPGPWKAGKNPCMTTVLDGHEGKAIYMDDPNNPHHIAWANAENSEGDLDIETALANATLIATAPEMFDALQKIAKMTPGTSFGTDDCCSYYESECGTCYEMISIAQEALRKAQGESEVQK